MRGSCVRSGVFSTVFAMIIQQYRVSPSRIPGAGKGIFLERTVKRGSVIIAPTEVRNAHLFFGAAVDALPPALQSTSIRWFEDYCTIDPDWNDECYINHSFEPNGLWHLGFVFALDDLQAGTELTIDYRFLIKEGETPGFRDALTNQEIRGFSWQESLRHSTRQLQDIMEKRPLMAVER